VRMARGPKDHLGARIAYDSESDRMILFGGLGKDWLFYDDTWAYDYNTNTWEEMKPDPEPPYVSRHAMVYSVATDRIILFGGESDDGVPYTYTDEVWAYDYNNNTWTKMTP
jgi:N-acetylneuraminic acid mutarotase